MSSEENYLKTELYSLIKEDEQIFEFLQSGATDGMWYWDLTQPENEWMNDRFWQELGYDPEQKAHLASEWQDIINQDDLNLALTNFQQHCDNPAHPYDQEVRYCHKNGSTVWIRCRGIAIRDHSGTPIRMLGSHSNITALKESEARYQRNVLELDRAYDTIKVALEESEKMFDLAPDANLKLNAKGCILKANAQAELLFGYKKAELEQMNVFDLMPKKHLDEHKEYLGSYFSAAANQVPTGFRKRTISVVDKAQKVLTIEVTLNLIPTSHGDIVLATIRDISEKEALIASLQQQLEENRKLQALTLLDPLTKIFNRRQFDTMMVEETAKANRHKQALSLLLFDIDHFKSVNDQYGHDAGDKILVQLTELVSAFIRTGDTFARIGGEEFAIILPYTSVESAQTMADRIIFECEKCAYQINANLTLSITVSIGVSALASSENNWLPLFERADKALYQAKAAGRNRVEVKALT